MHKLKQEVFGTLLPEGTEKKKKKKKIYVSMSGLVSQNKPLSPPKKETKMKKSANDS
jgi:hypothetical protein